MSLAFADLDGEDGRVLATRQLPLVPQYEAYPAGFAPVNGTRMLRQNAADLAAVEIAFDALQAQTPADPLATQEFYRARAGVRARQDDPAAQAAAHSTSAFSPARWRVNGPVSNQPAFLAAFGCKPGQRMHRLGAQQVAIWR
jgi:putative endopeptidase